MGNLIANYIKDETTSLLDRIYGIYWITLLLLKKPIKNSFCFYPVHPV